MESYVTLAEAQSYWSSMQPNGIVGAIVDGRELTPAELAQALAKGREWYAARFGSTSPFDYAAQQTFPVEDV